MGLKKFTSPALPLAPQAYSREYADQLVRVLNLYFKQLDSSSGIVVDNLSISVREGSVTIPTQVDLANLRVGDVYMDTTASNVLKVKT